MNFIISITNNGTKKLCVSLLDVCDISYMVVVEVTVPTSFMDVVETERLIDHNGPAQSPRY